jgi:UDP-glucose 4-epimerase
VAIFASQIARGQRPVVFGDGRQTRDFIYVGDIVAFIVSALAFEGSLAGAMPDGPAYNVSTGLGAPVDQIAAYLGAFSGAPKVPEYRPAREGDIPHSVLDPGKAFERLGWRAQQPLETGLSFTWRWMKSTLE